MNRSPFLYRLGIIVVLLIALAMRVAPAFHSLPYIDYIDEGYVLSIEVINHGSLDTRCYGFPPFAAYLTAAAALAYSPFYQVRTGHSLRHDLPKDKQLRTPEGDNCDLIAPSDYVRVGRLLVAALSLATLVVTGLLGRNLIDRRVAILPCLPWRFVRHSLCARPSSSSTALRPFSRCWHPISAFSSSGRAGGAPASALSHTAGIVAGLAFASKYNLFVCCGGVLVATIFHPPTRSKSGSRSQLSCG